MHDLKSSTFEFCECFLSIYDENEYNKSTMTLETMVSRRFYFSLVANYGSAVQTGNYFSKVINRNTKAMSGICLN